MFQLLAGLSILGGNIKVSQLSLEWHFNYCIGLLETVTSSWIETSLYKVHIAHSGYFTIYRIYPSRQSESH